MYVKYSKKIRLCQKDSMELQKLLSKARRAAEDYNMIEEGDKIAVGLSGGKDSMTLLYILATMSSRFRWIWGWGLTKKKYKQ